MAIRQSRGITLGKGTPQRLEGQNGDITIRSSRKGLKLYVKESNKWHSINLGIDLLSVVSSINRLEKDVKRLSNKTNNTPVVDKLLLRQSGGTSAVSIQNKSGLIAFRNSTDTSEAKVQAIPFDIGTNNTPGRGWGQLYYNSASTSHELESNGLKINASTNAPDSTEQALLQLTPKANDSIIRFNSSDGTTTSGKFIMGFDFLKADGSTSDARFKINNGSVFSDDSVFNLDSSGVYIAGELKFNSLSDGSITITDFVDEDNMASNSATKIPTQQSVKAYVDTEVAGLVDSAPAALDTLNELAAALGDDANFATTVTNSLALKAPLAAPAFTGDATFDSTTLAIDATNNRVGIGVTNPDSSLEVVGAGNDNSSYGLSVKNSSDTNLFYVRDDGVVSVLGNYFFAQHSNGAYFTGSIKARGGITDDDGDLGLGSGGNVDHMTISSGKVSIGNTSPNYLLHVGDDVGLSFINTPDKAIGLLSTTDDHEVAYIIGVGEGTNNIRSKYFVDDDTKYVGWDATYSTGLQGYEWKIANTQKMKLDTSGNLTLSGTVDGRDLATDGTKLDGIEASATADQTAGEILTLIEDGVDSVHYKDGSIDHVHLAVDAVDGDNIADNSINSEHYVDGSIDNAHIATDAVTGAKVADDTLDSQHYIAGSIDTEHIADDQVTYAKIQNVSNTNRILGRDSEGAGVIEEISPANVRTMINVENGAQANVSGNSGNAAIYDNSGTPAFKTSITKAEVQTLLNIEDGATADQTGPEIAAALNTDLGGNFTIGNQASDSATFSGPVIATELDISGDIDIDGTSNLDDVIMTGSVQIQAGFRNDGDIDLTNAAIDVDLIDNNSSALSFDSNGKAGILEIVTTNDSEKVKMSGRLDVSGITNITGTYLNVGGGYGSSGSTLDSSGNIQANGNLTVDGETTTAGLDSSENIILRNQRGIYIDNHPDGYSSAHYGGSIIQPRGALYRTGTNALTGAIKIHIPAGSGDASDWISMWVDVIDYATDESFTAYIQGYMYKNEPGSESADTEDHEWVNETAMIFAKKQDRDFTVSYGHDDTDYFVAIGAVDSTWNYLQVTVRDVQIGGPSNIEDYTGDWNISLVTDFGTTVHVSHTDNFPVVKGTNITELGTITTGTWNGGVIASAYLDSDTAHLSGTQTFSGNKTFSGTTTLSGTTTIADARITMKDTRSTYDAPDEFNKEVRFEFKQSSSIGGPVVSNATYGGLMTIAPWGDSSGDATHQLFFHADASTTTNGGIFWRTGDPGDSSTSDWGDFKQIFTTLDTIPVSNGGTGATSLNNLITLGTHTTGNYVASLTAGNLIDVGGGAEGGTPTIDVDLSEAAEADIADGDYILFLDGGATGTEKKEALHDLATLFAGSGLTATNSVLSVDTLNQDTTGNAATATALETARNIGGVSFDGTANINLPGVNTAGNQDTSGTAANATHVTVADNENTNENNLIPFIENESATGNVGLESDGDLYYNPSSGALHAGEVVVSNVDAVNGDFDGTLEADAITIGGVTLSEYISDTVGAMFSGNTETRISATYDDSDNTIDLVVDDMTADTNTQLSDEQVQDIVGAMVSSNTESNISVTYDDSSGKLNFAATDTNTQLSTEQVQDIVGAMFTSNTETRISAAYDDSDGTIDLVVDDMTADTNTNQLTTFVLEDDSGDEVTISHGKEIKFNAGNGMVINWSDTDNGTDGDPFDLDFSVNHNATTNYDSNQHVDHTAVSITAGDGMTGGGTIASTRTLNVVGGTGITANANDIAVSAAQTSITSILATDLKIGEDDQTKIDFETADEIHFYAANVHQVKLVDNIFTPEADSDVDLGATSTRWKKLWVDDIQTTNDIVAGGDITLGGNDIKASGSNVAFSTSADAATQSVAGDLQIGGQDILSGDSTTCITLSNSTGNVTFAGDITVTGNDIRNSDGTTTITMDSSENVTIAGDLTVNGNDFSFDAGASTIGIADASGTNTAGNNLTISAGAGTGSGAGGSLVFATADGGGSGSSANSHANALVLADDLDATFGKDISISGDNINFSGGGIINAQSDLTFRCDSDQASTPNTSKFSFKNGGNSEIASIDESGNLTASGTVEANAITIGGTALADAVTITNSTNAAHVYITDNESTNEENQITFIEGASGGGANRGLEADGNFTYNPSTGMVTAEQVTASKAGAHNDLTVAATGTSSGSTFSSSVKLSNNDTDWYLKCTGGDTTAAGFFQIVDDSTQLLKIERQDDGGDVHVIKDLHVEGSNGIIAGAPIWIEYPFSVTNGVAGRPYYRDVDDLFGDFRKWDDYDTSPTTISRGDVAGHYVVPGNCTLKGLHAVVTNTTSSEDIVIGIYYGTPNLDSGLGTTLALAGSELTVGIDTHTYNYQKTGTFDVDLSAGDIIVPMVEHNNTAGTNQTFRGNITLKLITR